MNYEDLYGKPSTSKVNRTEIVMEWMTNLGNAYRGTLIDYDTTHYKLKRVDTGEIVDIPRSCCHVVNILDV